MGVCLEKSALTKSQLDNKPNIIVGPRKYIDSDINSNGNNTLIKSYKNNNKIEIEYKDFIKSENKGNQEDKKIDVNEDKYLIKSNILNISTQKISEKNILEKSEENNDKPPKPKIFVKSIYILKKILLNLTENKKLLLIKYNKYYQNVMIINLEDYKKVSGKIKIGGINGYGKEYDLNELKLKFEGYYINGKRNGKGKEYDEDIKFEGEYINGIKNGKGTEYNYDPKSTFEGEFLNGKKWKGIIKEYHGDNQKKIKFDGEYLNGKKKGKEYDMNGQLVFEGEYIDDKKWNGTIYNRNGFLFKIENGNGKVKEYDEYGELIFEGEYLNGKKKGKEYNKDFGKLTFEGEYLIGKRWNGKIREYQKPSPFGYWRCG